jgi:hypothetical protein
MSMLNLIWINTNILDMKKYMLICFLSMLMSKKYKWDKYKDGDS